MENLDETTLRKTYRDRWDPCKYLEECVGQNTYWEPIFLRCLHETVQEGKITGPRGIDIGCGPTVHRMSILARACDELLACDYTQQNVNLIKTWLETDQPEDVYTASLKSVSVLEGHKDENLGQKQLCDRLRSKVKDVVQCDVTSSESVSKLLQYGGQFDCAISNGCLESACLSYDTYLKVLENVASLLKSGAGLVLSGYLSGNYYCVNGTRYDCLDLTESEVKDGLLKAGFKVDSMSVWTVDNTSYVDVTNSKAGFFSISHKM